MSDHTENLNDKYPGAGTYRFGESKDDCEAQLEMVRAGSKRLDCAALAEFGGDKNALPKAGRCDIATDWAGAPALVTKTMRVEQHRFCDVTWELAMDEGIGNNLADWQAYRSEYFGRNGGFDPEMMLVFERFDVVEDLAGRGITPTKD